MEPKLPKYVANAIRTPDGTVLRSRHTHDYQTHKDANGEQYMVDGGLSYLRRNVNQEPYEELSVESSQPFEDIRQAIEWGTYGKDGKDPLHYVKMSGMSDDHIKNVLDQLDMIETERQQRKKEMAPSLEIRHEFREAVGLPSGRKEESVVAQSPNAWVVHFFNMELAYRQEHGIEILDTEPAGS